MARRRDSRFRASFRADQFGWSRYKIDQKGYGEVGALHKGPVSHVPCRFFNELVSGDIAQMVRLPIPPFAMTTFVHDDGQKKHAGSLFSSVDFNYEREQPPLPDFDICMERMPADCAGILLLDIVVANPDRSRDNIWCDNEAAPSELLIYDHDQALMGGEHDGIDRIKAFQNELGLRYWSIDGSNHHPFLKRLSSPELLNEWYDRFYSVPKWFIRESCDEARATGSVTKTDAKKVAAFLEYRTRNLESIVQQHRSEFTGIADWSGGGLL